jgi:2-polyprenyl-3-methyl-5-hydroxy-6-metoxy-1,4-benzoquinol methylase
MRRLSPSWVKQKTTRAIGELRRLGEVRRQLDDMEAMLRFALQAIHQIEERHRQWLLNHPGAVRRDDVEQTGESFDFQWRELPLKPDEPRVGTGGSAAEAICVYTGLGRDWFAGKRVLDLGCGGGRFSLGFLELGADVTAVDQSQGGLAATRQLCERFGERLTTRHVDLLSWSEPDAFDLVFSYGVVHHTGNTYLAIDNAIQKVAPGGRLFLMVYGFPTTANDCRELNHYEELRRELAPHDLQTRRRIVEQRFGEQAHGWFDAASPRINDLLSFDELQRFLAARGFADIRRTDEGRNHHIMAARV